MGCLKLSYYEKNLSQLRPLRKFEDQEKTCVSLLYFGARYYNSDISVWLSVDPLADKYPSLSPYNYCAGNPVMLVDPDGRSFWEPDKNGNLTAEKGDGITSLSEYLNVSYSEASKIFNDGSNWDGSNYECGILDIEGHTLEIKDENLKSIVKDNHYKENNFEVNLLSDSQWKTQMPNKIGCFWANTDILGYVPSPANAIFTASENGSGVTVLPTNIDGRKMINSYLKNNLPIMVGVHHTNGLGYNEGTTDHYVTIMGYGKDDGVPYYRFFDVGSSHRSSGASPNNRLYLGPGGVLMGTTAYNNKMYYVSQVRPK